MLDTNAVVTLLRSHKSLQHRLQLADWVGISILSQIEFLAFPNLGANDRSIFRQFADSIDVVGLDRSDIALIDRAVNLRSQHRIKLPDAVIAATAAERNAILITDDRQLLNVPGLKATGTSGP